METQTEVQNALLGLFLRNLCSFSKKFTLPSRRSPGVKFDLERATVLASVKTFAGLSIGDRCRIIQRTEWLSEEHDCLDKNTRNFLRNNEEFVILGFVQVLGKIKKTGLTVETVFCVLGIPKPKLHNYYWQDIIAYNESGCPKVATDPMLLFFTGNLLKDDGSIGDVV